MASAAASSGFAGSASNTVVSAVRASVWVRDDRENQGSGRGVGQSHAHACLFSTTETKLALFHHSLSKKTLFHNYVS